MIQKEIQQTYREIINHIEKKELKEAFDLLTSYLSELKSYEFSNEKENLENTYKYMLQYVVQGIEDPDRQLIYNKLVADVYELSDLLKYRLMEQISSSYIFSQKRYVGLTEKMEPAYLLSMLRLYAETEAPEIDLSAKYEKAVSQLFSAFWLIERMNSEDEKQFVDLMKDDLISSEDKMILISALTLSLFTFFDEKKLLLLIDSYNFSENIEIKQRVLVGLVLNLYIYNNRMKYYPSVRNRLVFLFDEEQVVKHVRAIIIQLIRTKQTDSITKMMNEEIIPGIRKINPRFNGKIDINELMANAEDQNPEWQKMLQDSGITDKLKEFSELQIEGADVYMSAFSQLKGFPFFNEIHHWFLPFTSKSQVVSQLFTDKGEMKTFIEAITKGSFLCNSDKYSFCLNLMQVPKSYRDEMMKAFKFESEQIQELKAEEENMDKSAKAEQLSNQYIQDLYRFFRLFQHKVDFQDVFSMPFDFHNTWMFKFLSSDETLLRVIGEFYFTKRMYKEALDIFINIYEAGVGTELLQKIGYSYQMLGELEQAVSFYKQSELIQGENSWINRKIAYCYRQLNRPEEAFLYYKRIEKEDPDNLQIQTNLGHCCLEIKNYKEALKYYFKVEYLTKENISVWRAIAWTSFLYGKKEQALKYYEQIIERSSSYQDYINIGHVVWSLGNRQKALDYYWKGVSKNKLDITAVLTEIENDKSNLIKSGVSAEEIPMMIDRLKYLFEDNKKDGGFV